jgi:tetratricopeptide (TPR) repeat protein
MRRDISQNGRKHLEAELMANADNPDLSMVIKLGHTCLDKPHHNSDAAYSGALLFEWAHFRGFDLNLQEKALLARAHAEVWQSRGLAAEDFHLDRARLLYDETLRANPDLIEDSTTWLDFARVLLASGAAEEAIGVFQHMLVTFEGDPEIPNWLFYMGATLKAKGLHDEAANYLFEAASSGPPRFFNKLDMMFIISRNIEEEGTKRGEPNEEAYEMVFQHLQLEGRLPEELTYEEWLHDSNTWRMLADKCALHGMFSLSTDLYAQGLMKDLNAFKKPKLWFGFAKSCHRCKRDSDARLAIKQALTMDPYNRQLEKADEILNTETHLFEEFMERSISDIIDRLHKHHDKDHKGASRLQAMFKGKSERRGLLKSVGSGGGGAEGVKKLVASRAVLLGGSHPVFLHAKASWLGTVNSITATDMHGVKAVLMLSDPFTPIKELSSLPRKFKLRMAANVIDDDHHEIVLSFLDDTTNEFIQRSFTLTFKEEYGSGAALSPVRRLKFKDTHETITDITAFEVEKGAINFLDTLYFYHVRVEDEETIFAFTHPLTGKRVDILLRREHIDRSQNLVKASRMLLSVCQTHPELRQKVFDLPEGVASNSKESDADDVREGMKVFTSQGYVPIPHTDKRVTVIVKEGSVHARSGLVLEFKEANGRAIVSNHLEKVVAHHDRPLTKDEKAAIEYNKAVHSTKPALRRAKSSRKARRMELERAKTADKDLFDLSDVVVEKAHKERKDAGIASKVPSEDNSVSSAMRDMFVPGMDDHRINTELEVTSNAEAGATGDVVAGKELLSKMSKSDQAKQQKGGEEPSSPGRAAKKNESKKDIALRIAAAKKAAAEAEESKNKGKLEGDGGDDEVSVLTVESSEKKGDAPTSPKPQERQERADPQSKNVPDGAGSLTGEEGEEEEDSDEELVDGAISAKNRRKEERRLARKKAMKAKLEKGANTGSSSMMQFGEEDEEEKKKERERKKKAAREKMMQEKARMEALAKERRREREQASSLTEDDLQDLGEKKTEKSSKKQRKRAGEKAALDAAVFLKHQEARSNASEYLLERSRAARRKILSDETRSYLTARANAAKLQAMEMEQEQKMREEREAREEAGANSEIGKIGRKMMNLKRKGKKLVDTLKGRKGRKGDRDTETSDDASVGREGEGSMAIPDSMSHDSFDGTDIATAEEATASYAEDAEMAAIADSQEMTLGGRGSESFNGSAGDQMAMPVQEEEEEEMDEEARLRASVAEAAKKPKPVQLSRYPVFIKPKIPHEPVKIDMFQKPTLSVRQQHKLRRPMSPSDLPESAFASAEGLITALRAYYSGAPLPVSSPVAPVSESVHVPAPVTESVPETAEESKAEVDSAPPVPGSAPAPAPAPAPASEVVPKEEEKDNKPAKEMSEQPSDESKAAEGGEEGEKGSDTPPSVVSNTPAEKVESEAEASGEKKQEEATDAKSAGSGAGPLPSSDEAKADGVGNKPSEVTVPASAPAPASASATAPAMSSPASPGPAQKVSMQSFLGEHEASPLSIEDALRMADSVQIETSPIKRSKGAIRPFVPTAITQRPLPVNAHLASSLFNPAGVTQVSVIQDQRADEYLARKRALERKKARLVELGRGSAAHGPHDKAMSKSTSALPSAASLSLSPLDRELEALGPFDPARSVNNLGFLDMLARDPLIELGKQSVRVSKSRGYAGSDGEYASHWRNLLEKSLYLYKDGAVLRKAILSLLKLCPQRVTKLEAFCALADSEGSQIEAIGRLGDPEFLREVKLVCSLLPVLEILGSMDGALSQSDIYGGGARAASPNSTSRRLMLPESAGLSAPNTAESRRRQGNDPSMMQFLTSNDSPGHKNKTLGGSSALKAIRHMTGDEPTAFEELYSPGIPGTAPGDVRAQMAASTHTHTSSSMHSVGSHGSAGKIRVHTSQAESLLPHMNMHMASPIVQSRGTSIKMPGAGKAQEPPSESLSASSQTSLDGRRPELGPAVSTTDAISTGQQLAWNAVGDALGVVSVGSDPISPTRPIRSSSPLSFNASRGRVPKTEGNKSYSGSIDNLLADSRSPAVLRPGGSVGGVSSLAGGSVVGALPAPLKQNSVRLAHAIEAIYERSPANVVVMCRRDAQRAAGEEVLSRSTLEEMRSKATKRSEEMIELRSSRAAHNTAVSFGMST